MAYVPLGQPVGLCGSYDVPAPLPGNPEVNGVTFALRGTPDPDRSRFWLVLAREPYIRRPATSYSSHPEPFQTLQPAKSILFSFDFFKFVLRNKPDFFKCLI